MIYPKVEAEIEVIKEGGKKLAAIREKLENLVREGGNSWEIEVLAEELIAKAGGKPSFRMVPRYFWATCVNVNEGVVHGIPSKHVVFKKGDLVSIDVGMFYKGFHVDTSITLLVGPVDSKKKKFLEVGKLALKNAIRVCLENNHVGDISKAIEQTILSGNFRPITALVGHGIGRNLHEDPFIPCFLKDKVENTPKIPLGTTLAIEVMYTEGSPDVVLDDDGWTIRTKDGKMAALFEETVAVTRHGPLVLTRN